jgi:hypothetical protein
MEDTRGTVKICVIIVQFGREGEEGAEKRDMKLTIAKCVDILRFVVEMRRTCWVEAVLQQLIKDVSKV